VKLINCQKPFFLLLSIALIPLYTRASDVKNSPREPVKAEIINIGESGQELQVFNRRTGGLIRVDKQPKVIIAKKMTLEVPPGSKKPFAHLKFITSSGADIDPIVQVGPNSKKTRYWFPCQAEEGKFVFAWGLNTNQDPECREIVVKGGVARVSMSLTFHSFISKSTDLTQVARNQLKTKGLSDFYTSQVDSPESINVSPESSGITIVQVNSSDKQIIINALVGNVSITADDRPGEIILEEGLSFDSNEPDNRKPIEITEETQWAIAAFVDPNNWSESVAPQIESLRQEPSLQKFLGNSQSGESPTPTPELTPTPAPPIIR
jgi:hypothetical protein